jgi:hypothetical protein
MFYAANMRVTSELYKKKMAALGWSQSKRGGTRKWKPQQKEADSKKRAKKTEDEEFSLSDEDEEWHTAITTPCDIKIQNIMLLCDVQK